jgi:hypothetical protein
MAATQQSILEELDGGPVEEPPRDDLAEQADEASATPSTTAAPAAEEPVVEEEPDTRPERRVSIHALHEERERRKESEAQLQQLREQAAKMEERFAQFQQRWQEQQAAAQQPQEPEVTYEDNPAEYLRRQTEKLQQETEAQRQRNQQQEELAQQQEAYRNFYAQVTSQEQQFAQSQADYYDAVQHLREARAQEYAAAGYDPQQVQTIITQEAHSVAANALRNGRNPAQAFYELAKLRGWSTAQASAAAPEPPPVSEEVQRLETVRRGVEANQTLGTAGETGGRLTLAQLSEMDDDEFMAATDGDNWRKLWETSARR